MRLPLRTHYEKRSMPNVFLLVFGPRSHIQIDAVIDTGSSYTILSYKDAELLQIPFKHKEIVTKVQGISEGTAKLCKCDKPLRFKMKKEDGTLFGVTKEGTYISQEKEGANITILGTDFLKENNLVLYFNPNGKAFLEENIHQDQ